MAGDPISVQDVTTAPSEKFHDIAKSVGEELKEKLAGKEDAAIKTVDAFDIHATEDYQEILNRVLSHEVSGIALY
jgi:hypothetical protein